MPAAPRTLATRRKSLSVILFLCLAALATGPLSSTTEANRRGGVAVQGTILRVRCGAARQGAVCEIEGQRVFVELTGAAVFANGERANCEALVPGRRFAAYGPVASRDPLALDACLFIQRSAADDVVEICGQITRIRAAQGILVLAVPGRGDTVVRTDPDITRFSVEGEPAMFDDLAIGMRACAIGVIHPGDPAPVLRPTLRVQARFERE